MSISSLWISNTSLNMKHIPVEDNPSIARDPVTGAIINVDQVAYENRMRSKRKREESENKIKQLEDDISQIKEMLSLLIQRRD